MNFDGEITPALSGVRSGIIYNDANELTSLTSGGVTDLDRDFGGFDARLVLKGRLAERPFSITIGGAWDKQDEHRRGFVNNSGDLGALRRDEDDVPLPRPDAAPRKEPDDATVQAPPPDIGTNG